MNDVRKSIGIVFQYPSLENNFPKALESDFSIKFIEVAKPIITEVKAEKSKHFISSKISFAFYFVFRENLKYVLRRNNFLM
jgi:hypothetical protein